MKGFTISRNQWLGLSSILALVFLWQLAAAWIHLPLILPTPCATFAQIAALMVKAEFWHHLGATLGRGFMGFGLALLAGILLGILAGRYRSFEAFLRPIIITMRSTPVMSLIVLALIWFKGEWVPVFVTILMAFPLIIQNIIEGIHSIDKELLEMVSLYRVRKYRIYTNLYLPSVIPFLAAAISSGLGITWKVLIAAEVLSYPTWGIGAQMDTARVYLQTDKVFAWTVVVVVIGLIFDYLLDFLIKKPFVAWKGNLNG